MGAHVHDLLSKIVLVPSFFACLGVLAGAQTASLGTAQTILRLKAGTAAPQLLSLQTPGKIAWPNKAAEKLISTAMLDGHTVPLEWKLVARAEHKDEKRVSFYI
jgi:hypothetical protein